MAMCGPSLKCRVLVSLLLVFASGFGVLALYLLDTRDELRRGIMFIQAREIGAGLDAGSDLSRLPTHQAGGELSYTLYSAQGEVLWHSANLARPRRLRRGTLTDELDLFRAPVRSGRVISVPVTLTDRSILMVAKEDRLERELIGELLRIRAMRGALMLVPFCLFAVGLIFVLLQWTLRPVRQAARLAADIGPHEPGRRIALDELPREIVPLARAANDGLARLARAYEYEQQVVADAAHELRTPLTVLDLRLQKCRIEGRADWSAITREMGHIHKLVGQLLALARQDRARDGHGPGADLARLPRVVREAVASMLPLFEAHGRLVDADIEEDVIVRGNADLLREAIRNALENALFHGVGAVHVRLSRSGGDVATLDVMDQGAGVPLASQEDMFRRFHKGRQASAGSGLGLAIVRSTLRNVGGDARFVGADPCILRLSFIEVEQAGRPADT
jgi:signal transduction histidine kinase